MSQQIPLNYEFGPFQLEATARRLLRNGTLVPLQPKAFEMLLVLIQQRERVIKKEELIERLWPDSIVEEANLTQHIYLLRKALGEGSEGQRYIVTVPGRGYRFVAEVRQVAVENGNHGSQSAGAARMAEASGKADAATEAATGRAAIAGSNMTKSNKRRATTALRISVLGLIALTAAAVAYALFIREKRPSPHPAITSLAVLPLENLSGDPAQEYFADGMTEALISNLTQVRALRVISRTSVMRFKGSRASLQEIARELNVDAVIEGSVQRAGGRVKITARLIRAADETPLGSFDYERELADVLKLQSSVARAVADEIRIRMTAEERARLTARSIRPEAYEEYLLGRYAIRRQNEENLKLAIGHFERAIQLEADYAAAWAGLSVAWQHRGIWGAKSFKEVEQPVRNAAMKAIKLDASIAEAHTSLAHLKKLYDWDWAGSEQDYRRALALDPGNGEAHRLFANLLMALGRHVEATGEIQAAELLDPLSSLVQSDFGRVLYRARNYPQAERRFMQAIALDPLNQGAYSRLGDLYLEMGRYDDAIANYGKREALQGGYNRGYAPDLAQVYARMGRRDEALRLLNGLRRTTEPARFPNRVAAAAWTSLGDKDEAFSLLFKAVEERSVLPFFKEDPSFDSLRSDPRWKELLRRMSFPEEQPGR